MEFKREVVKALLIDSAAEWLPNEKNSTKIGYEINTHFGRLTPQGIKYIAELGEGKLRARKAYESSSWSITLKTKKCIIARVNGKNRIHKFIQQCRLKGWLASHINVKSLVDIYNKASEEVICG